MTDRQKLYNDAINRFGIFNQLGIAQEELAELIVALSKIIRYKANSVTVGNLIEELADVEIMISQIKISLMISETDIQTAKDAKLKRLREMLDNNA